MILEGVVTTQNLAGELNVAAMGPIVDPGMHGLLLRPFKSTRTWQNLLQQPAGVFHVVDDVELLVRAALNLFEQPPSVVETEKVAGQVLADACRWYEFEVREVQEATDRAEIRVEVVHTGTLKEFWGFNRAKHAVIEYAILASRLFMLEESEVRWQYRQLKTIVEKTAGPAEEQAFGLVTQYILQKWPHFLERAAAGQIACTDKPANRDRKQTR